VSPHYSHTATALTNAQALALNDLGTQVGTWLTWHRHVAVLDALEHCIAWPAAVQT
jgi:hypothetical protein